MSTFILCLSILLLLGVVNVASAQQTDTATTRKKLNLYHQNIEKSYHSERSSNQYLTKDGSYSVPEPKKYYTPPFTGQKALDRAVAAYREDVKESPLIQLLNKIAPFVNNRFEFGVYKIYDLPVVSRDNPLFQSYHSKAKRK